jgi:hypothetical protein
MIWIASARMTTPTDFGQLAMLNGTLTGVAGVIIPVAIGVAVAKLRLRAGSSG